MGGFRTEPDGVADSVSQHPKRFVPPTEWIRRHRWFLVLLGLGVVLRIAVLVAFSDAVTAAVSVDHLAASDPSVLAFGPHVGYAAGFLTPLRHLSHAFVVVAVVQHLAGLLTAVAVYTLLGRWDVWPWLGALSVMPVLLGPRLVMSEQLIAPDTVVTLLITATALVLGWRARPGILAAGLAGLLAGLVATMSPSGGLMVAVLVLVVALAADGAFGRLTAVAAVLVGFGIVVAAYAGWQHGRAGSYSGTELADTVGIHGWSDVSAGEVGELLGRDASQRGDVDLAAYADDPARQAPVDALATYADAVDVPMWPFLAGPLVGLLALLGLGRSGSSRMRPVVLLTMLLPAALALGPVLIGAGTWHATVASLAIWPAAGTLGLTAILRGRRSARADRPQLDDADRAAAADFDQRYAEPRLARVVVVIAAYNEGPGLPRVLDTIPDDVCGIPADVVVVDDGSSDETADAALAHRRAYLVRPGTNRGQGAALRLGYWIARDHGAEFVITTDADGQYDTADFPAVLEPILAGRADFVTGSRRLGHQHTFDRFRRLGVYVFAWIVSAMVGQHVTDTSFGLRAMRADLTGRVTLNQPQYQSSELLIGTFSHGFRVAEVPGTMHLRTAGATKKGRNLVYGRRYAGVVFGTWWREGCPRPVTERARALRIRSRG